MALSSGWQKLRGANARRRDRKAQDAAQPDAEPGAGRAERNGRRWRWVWIGLALTPAALLAVLVGLLLLFDPNDHRDWIADQASARLGRPVQIGAIHWRLRPRFQLTLDNVVLGAAAKGEAELARFARLRVVLRPLSLLFGRLQIENIELHGLRLQLGSASKPEDGAPGEAPEESARQTPAASRTPLAALSRVALARAPLPALRAAGLSRAKALAVRGAARAFADGVLRARRFPHMDDAAVVDALTQLRGVGEWTAHMLLMFSLGRPDVLPVGDYGVRKGARRLYGLAELPTPRELEALAEPWRPYRSIASWYLWRAAEVLPP